MFFKETTTTAKYSIMNEFPTTVSSTQQQNTLLMTPNTVKSIEESILASLEAASANSTYLPPTTTTPTSSSSTIIIPSTASGSFVPPLPQQQQHPTIILANNWHGASVNYKNESFDEEEEQPQKITKCGGRGKKVVSKQPLKEKKKRGRRSNKNDEETEDLSDRRTIRRERNKLAAARCRKRRVDHTNALLEETSTLEDTRSSLQQQIASLQQKKEEFEFLLQAHAPSCLLDQKPTLICPTTPTLRVGGIGEVSSNIKQEQIKKPQRPTSLPMVTNGNGNNCPISITTPSNGLWTPSIDGLIGDWTSTGLTPVAVGGGVLNSNSLMTPVVTPGGGVSKFVLL